MVTQYSGENKNVVDKHNKLVTEYNVLLQTHADLIKKFNLLVSELQDPSLATFLAAKAVKVYQHPGIHGAVNKTLIHVLPAAQEALHKGQLGGVAWFNESQSKVQNFLQAYGGEGSQDWVPAASGFIVYGSVLIPVTIACWCIMEFVCKLQKLILFGHVYLAVTGILMAAFAAGTGEDPLSTFAEQDPQLYQFAQCGFALLFILYGLLSSSALCCGDSDNSWRWLHILVTVSFGAVYYVLVWTPAMTDELPKVDDFIESLYMPDTAELQKPQAPGGKDDGEDVPRLLTITPYLVFAVVFSMLFLFEGSGSKRSSEDEPKGD